MTLDPDQLADIARFREEAGLPPLGSEQEAENEAKVAAQPTPPPEPEQPVERDWEALFVTAADLARRALHVCRQDPLVGMVTLTAHPDPGDPARSTSVTVFYNSNAEPFKAFEIRIDGWPSALLVPVSWLPANG